MVVVVGSVMRDDAEIKHIFFACARHVSAVLDHGIPSAAHGILKVRKIGIYVEHYGIWPRMRIYARM